MTGLDDTAEDPASAPAETDPKRQRETPTRASPLEPEAAPPAPGRGTTGRPGPLRQLRHSLLRNLFASSLYRLSLPRSGPAELAAHPADPWPGDAATANAIFQGRYRFAGSEVQLFNQPPWASPSPSPEWQAEASAFGWLRHFGAGGGAAARQGARELVRSWILANTEFDGLTWRPDVMGHRLMAWTSHADFLLQDADPPFRQAFLAALDQQTRHLGRAWTMAAAGADRLGALAGLMLGTATLDPSGRRARGLGAHISAELAGQILPDGGHASRNPSQHLAALRDLIWLNAGLEAAGAPIPAGIGQAIARMGPMLAFFRHGDGGLALFNGADEGEREEITQTLAHAGNPKRPMATATHSGFERLMAGKSVALVDAGIPPSPPFDGVAHAGTLSFEFSAAKHRIIVNCGHRAGPQWLQASRATAAQSTVAIGNTNSSEVLAQGLGHRPTSVGIQRKEDEGNLWLETEHDGYVARAGLYHRRRLYLSAEGTQLRGEDVIEGARAEGRAGLPIAARFHLHPDVHASQTADGALLKLANGQGWRFRAAGGTVAVEESVYLGAPGKVRRAEQIIISAEVQPGGTTLNWALTRI